MGSTFEVGSISEHITPAEKISLEPTLTFNLAMIPGLDEEKKALDKTLSGNYFTNRGSRRFT